MREIRVDEPGGPSDLVRHDGYWYLTLQQGVQDEAHVLVLVYTDAGVKVIGAKWPCSSGAFPRLYSTGPDWWLAYRDRDERITVKRNGVDAWRSPMRAGGTHPVCFGGMLSLAMFAWMREGDNEVFTAQLGAIDAQKPAGSGAADGLSHIGPTGVVLWKDNYASVPGMTAPSYDYHIVAGEHPVSGVLVRRDGLETRLWAGRDTFEPRIADGRAGEWGVTTWNKGGVLFATIDATDFVAPVVDAPWPPGEGWDRRDDITEVDIVDYLLGQTWARDGMHVPSDAVTYSHPFQARSGTGWTQHTKFAPPDTRAATWTYSDQWVGLAHDATNELAQGYRFVNPGTDRTAPIYPRRMKVGYAHKYVAEIDILDLATNTPRRSTWTGWVDSVWMNRRPVGDIPAMTLHAVVMFEPAAQAPTRGWLERNIGAKGYGCWYWHQEKKSTGVVDMRWLGTKTAPRVPDIPVRYHDALPVPPTAPPKPPVPPEPPMPVWQYNDADVDEAARYLRAKYTAPADQGGLGRDDVDNLGWGRWLHDFFRDRYAGMAQRATLAKINTEINRIVGLPADAWPPGFEALPARPSRLVGPLRIAADKSAFIDDTGPVLPTLCHLGDGLSRWTRDPGGVSALLDDIAASGYDGVRTWTVLGGSNYWNGREVGPMYQGNYFDHVSAFADALRQRGLRWLVSQGDAMRLFPTTPERQAFMRALAELLDLELVAGVDAGNELLWNGETDPTKMREAVDAFRAVLPCAVWSLTSPGSEEKADLDTFSGSVFDVHGYRDNRSWDKVRHIFSIGYEGKPTTRLGIQSEPFGYGDLVSASANKDELTTGVMQLACAVALMARQAWVYFSGPGVKSDAGQRLQDMPGFRETCAMRDALPRDLMTFGSLVHGGASQKGRRVFAVPGTDSSRCDHALHADGRFVCAVYGESWRNAYQEKTCQIEKRIDCGEAGYVIVGRA